MSIPKFILCCLLLLSHKGKSQTTFQKVLGGPGDDYGFSVCQNHWKGFVIAGYTGGHGAGINDFFVTQTDSLGNMVWQKTYGGTRDDEAYSVKQTRDNGYIIAGYSKSFGAINYDAYLVKINGGGDTLWTKTYGGFSNDFANVIRETTDGGFILAGYTTTFVSGADSGGVYLIKTDSMGNLKWSKSFGGATAISDGYSIEQTIDKGYIITGYTNGFNEPNGDVFLLKTDSLGVLSWTKTYGSQHVDWGNSVKQTNDGGYIITGSSSFDTTHLTDVYLIKTNALGDTTWTKTFGGTGYEFGQSIEQTDDGGYIITGYTNSYGAGSYDVFLIKTDGNGDLTWAKVMGGGEDDEGNFVQQTTDGGYIISGISNSFSTGSYDMYLIKTDANGNSCNEIAVQIGSDFPSTQQSSQTSQLNTVSTIVNNIHTLLDSASVITDACLQNGITSLNIDSPVLTVFPNPNNGIFDFIFDDHKQEKVTIFIQNILGETVYISDNLARINLQYLPSGSYFAKVACSNKIFSKKIVIIK